MSSSRDATPTPERIGEIVEHSATDVSMPLDMIMMYGTIR